MRSFSPQVVGLRRTVLDSKTPAWNWMKKARSGSTNIADQPAKAPMQWATLPIAYSLRQSPIMRGRLLRILFLLTSCLMWMKAAARQRYSDRKSDGSEKSVSVGVALGVSRIMKQNTTQR